MGLFIFLCRREQLIMKNASASVLVTVCKSKTLIGAAILPHCMSAACQMEMEGI